jgi:hypothetical protein
LPIEPTEGWWLIQCTKMQMCPIQTYLICLFYIRNRFINPMLFAYSSELYNFRKWSQVDHLWNHKWQDGLRPFSKLYKAVLIMFFTNCCIGNSFLNDRVGCNYVTEWNVWNQNKSDKQEHTFLLKLNLAWKHRCC